MKTTVKAIIFTAVSLVFILKFIIPWLGYTVSSEPTMHYKYLPAEMPSKDVKSGDVPKNIILVVADGFGFSHLSLAHATASQEEKTLWEGFESYGFLQPHPLSGFLTDSAASATAIATGKDTRNGTIGKQVDGVTQKSFFKVAKEKQHAVGIVTDSYIWDATPASFYAYSPSRKKVVNILEQLVDAELDIVFGELEDVGEEDVPGWQDTVKMLSQNYEVFERKLPKNEMSRPTMAIFDENSVIDMDSPVNLVEMVDVALTSFLSNDSPFVLLVETEEPDSASHKKDVKRMVKSNKTINSVLKLIVESVKDRNDTLVVFTSDHETGGLVLDFLNTNDNVLPTYTTTHHTGSLVPVMAFGPGHQIASGNISNEELGKRFLALVNQK